MPEHNKLPTAHDTCTHGLWTSLVIRTVLPSVSGVALLSIAIFWFIIPDLEHHLMDGKRDVLRSLTQTVCTKLEAYHRQVLDGELTLAQAQTEALAMIRDLRYGEVQKDYFWVMDQQVHMVMHPYRPEIIGRDLKSEVDASGDYLYARLAHTAKNPEGGFVCYMYQWQDDPGRVEPKLSFVSPFEPWGWIVGTGMYTHDVTLQIQATSRRLAWVAVVALIIVSCLSGVVVWSGYRSEYRRRYAESAVVALNASLEQRITERTVELAEANERLKIQIDERQEAQRALAESLQRQVEFNTLQQELLGAGDLPSKLSRITDAITKICRLDFCRIWITTSCSVPSTDCLHAIAEDSEYRCRGCTQCLKLLASSGRYPNDNGDPYRHIPFGHRTIGQIATGAEHKFITNSVTTDERIRQHNWARELELVSLAAYQLRPPGGETIGVLAAFSKHETTPEVDAILESVANTATRVILNAKAEEDQQRLQIQLSQSQRLESVGQLAAGIAHEINTPTQFVGDNIRFLLGALPKLLDLLAQYQQVVEDCRTSTIDTSKFDTLAEAVKKANLNYLVTEIPQALSDSLEGLDRVTTIVRAMKDFSHPGQNTMALADLNRAIESTVTVARNEWKYFADMQLNLEPGMPPVLCLVGDINQVILNIVVNAAHAIKEARGDDGGKGTITVSSRHETGWIEIRIADTGTGIAAEHRDKVFDHFFTTKPVGMGTGQGLSFARRVIVDQHHGSISFETEPGQGTTFIIRLPVVDKGQSESRAARCSTAAVVAE